MTHSDPTARLRALAAACLVALACAAAAPGAPAAAQEPAPEADSRIVEEGGEEVKVTRFGGLDIVGELRSPQILYFLTRLRAEFDRPRLPHRSFLPELVATEHDAEALD